MKKNSMKTLKEKEFKRKFHKILFEINYKLILIILIIIMIKNHLYINLKT